MQQQEQQQQQLHKVIYCYILYTPSLTSSLRIFLGCESICLPCNFLFFPFHHSLADPTNYCVIVGNRDVNQLTHCTIHHHFLLLHYSREKRHTIAKELKLGLD